MNSLQQLEKLVAAGESETLEFKQSTGERREAARSLCGMLNSRGGVVLIGVEDKGRIVGQMTSGQTLAHLAQEIANIDPPVFPSIEVIPVQKDRQVIAIRVGAGGNRPYCYKGKAYRRVGNTTPEASRQEYNRLLLEQLHGENRWENQVASGWSLEDLDSAEIIRTLDEAIRRGRTEDPGTRDPQEILRGFGLMRDKEVLRAAVVLFGQQQKLIATMPQATLRVARFRGVDKTEFLDNRQLHGNVFYILLQAERFLRENLPVAGRVEPGIFQRVDDPVYPPMALREALANAVCHRDYSIGGGSVAVAVYDDRLELTSSGSLHFGITPKTLFEPHESLPWNPLIARVLYRRGIIESWGRGTLKMAELTARAGLPKPEILESGGCVVVRFASCLVPKISDKTDLTDRQRAILKILDKPGSALPLREIAKQLEDAATIRQIQWDLAQLQSFRLVKRTGAGRGARWRRQEKQNGFPSV